MIFLEILKFKDLKKLIILRENNFIKLKGYNKFKNENEGEEYWESKMKVVGNVVFRIGNYKIAEQHLRH